MNISRRLFLFGGVTAGAVLGLGLPRLAPVTFAKASIYKLRKIDYIQINFLLDDQASHEGADGVAIINVLQNGKRLMYLPMSIYGYLIWYAPPGCEILCDPNNPVGIDLKSKHGIGYVEMRSIDTLEDGREVRMSEEHYFNCDGEQIDFRATLMYRRGEGGFI